jgi:hypothetical protein
LQVLEKIKEIERDFALVMVTERIEESLVLLSELLCWPLEAMVSLPINARLSHLKRPLDAETRDLLKNWLWADDLLYAHFSNLLQRRVEAYGVERMRDAVQRLRQLNAETRAACSVKGSPRDELGGERKPTSNMVTGFEVNNRSGCDALARTELAYLQRLRERQLRKARAFG